MSSLIVFILHSALASELFQQEIGGGSGISCWHRAYEWQPPGVWDKWHRVVFNKLRSAERVDLSCVIADSSSVRALGGKKTKPNPADRGNAGSKHQLLVDAERIPLNVILTGANWNDSTQRVPLFDGVAPNAGRRGRPLRKPDGVQADRRYDGEHRRRCRNVPQIGKRRTLHGSDLGVTRPEVARTVDRLQQFLASAAV